MPFGAWCFDGRTDRTSGMTTKVHAPNLICDTMAVTEVSATQAYEV